MCLYEKKLIKSIRYMQASLTACAILPSVSHYVDGVLSCSDRLGPAFGVEVLLLCTIRANLVGSVIWTQIHMIDLL